MYLLRWIFLGVGVIVSFSLFAVWSYGHFARRSIGNKAYRIPTSNADAEDATLLDRTIEPLLEQYPNHSGAAFLQDPLIAFDARAQTARSAERSLDIQYYLWHHDTTGRLLQNELYAAAERGVRIRLLLDDMSKSGRDQELLALDKHPNIEIRLFNPGRNRTSSVRRAIEIGLRFFSFNRRMHNKAWIADNRVALVGGRNVGDEYFGANTQGNFRDTDLMLFGPAVEQTSSIFDEFWNADEVMPIETLYKRGTRWSDKKFSRKRQAWLAQAMATPWGKELSHNKPLVDYFTDGNIKIHWSDKIKVISDPPVKAAPVSRKRRQAGWMVYDLNALLYSAKKENWIISPYFVPGNSGAVLLSGQVMRGMKVRVLTNSLAANNVPMVHAGYSKYRKPLLEHGVELYELKPSFKDTKREIINTGRASLHSKAILVDNYKGFVGSFNLDPRSAQLNTEMGVIFEHSGLAEELKNFFVESTHEDTAWKLTLGEQGQIQWQGSQQTHQDEPDVSFSLKLFVHLLSWLPIESQL